MAMKRLDAPDAGGRVELLEIEAGARRERLADNLNELSERMTFSNLVQEAKEAMWKEVDRMVDDMLSIGEDLIQDSVDWAKDHQRALVGGSVTALLVGGALWYATRKKTVPLYAAYDMEDPYMTTETEETLAAKASGAWSKVKDEAHHVGDKAGEAYYSARSRAAEFSGTARERAAQAADVARERAQDAAEAAREASEKAREAAGEARRWAVKQPQENPATVVLGALAAGILIGILLPSGRRDRA